MATTRQPREKISSTPSPSPTVRRTPRASVPGSSDRDIHVKKQPVTEKPTPNYLKPTVRTSTTTTTARPAASTTSTGTRVPARKSLDKPPSSFQPHRPPSREKPVSKTSLAPSTRTSVSQRTSLDKSSRTKAPAASRSTVKRIRPSTALADHYASDASSCKSETEEKSEFPILDHEVDEHAELLCIPPLNDHELLNEFNESLVLKDPEVIFEAVKDYHTAPGIVDEHTAVEEKHVDIETEDGHEVEGNTTEGGHEVLEEVAVKTVEASGVDVRAPFPEKKEGAKSNEVIEEFQSKMMEKRKNKVLALVGAFETVMSMQEPSKGGAVPEDGGVKETVEEA